LVPYKRLSTPRTTGRSFPTSEPFKNPPKYCFNVPPDLEVIVAKHKFGPYLQDGAQWFKIRNRKYSQWTGWEKFFAVT
jgi:ATP-dependent DNA ligase